MNGKNVLGMILQTFTRRRLILSRHSEQWALFPFARVIV